MFCYYDMLTKQAGENKLEMTYEIRYFDDVIDLNVMYMLYCYPEVYTAFSSY